MKRKVFITKLSTFFPNEPVYNEEIEHYLGMVDGSPSRIKPIILRQNGIKVRYYALNKNQSITHSNAELAKNAIDKLNIHDSDRIQFLSCGTSTPDQMLPSHASMVHGLAFDYPIEIASLSGICMSGLMALKVAYMSILSNNSENAVTVCSELVSPIMLSKFFEEEYEHLKKIEKNPYISFEKNFLRFMLSDGASAMLLSSKPIGNFNLQIEGIKTYSYANEQPACMYMWAEKDENGELQSWKTYSSDKMSEKSVWCIKQDVRQLNEFAMKYFVDAVESS